MMGEDLKCDDLARSFRERYIMSDSKTYSEGFDEANSHTFLDEEFVWCWLSVIRDSRSNKQSLIGSLVVNIARDSFHMVAFLSSSIRRFRANQV